jgi:hypothetical protein
MSDLDWRREYRDATESPPRGAKERVWRNLQGAPRPTRRWVPALALACAAAVALAVVAWPRTDSTTWRTDGSVVAVQDARFSFDAPTNTLTLERGTVTASVWSGPALHVVAHGRRVEVEAAVVVVSVAGDVVTVTPVEGAVLVDSQRVEASQESRARATPQAAPVQALEPKDAKAQRASTLAQRALESHRYEDAARAFDEVARSGTLGAEAALLRKGDVELRHLAAPERALSTFTEGDARFPDGSLGPERGLSTLEALAELRRWGDVEARAARFLADFPSTERRQDVVRLRAQALFELGRPADACREVRELTGDSAQPLRARCSR